MNRSILIHIGTHKTGSTSIQQLCARAADQLLEDGILYPVAGRPNHAPAGHHTLAWSIQQKRGLDKLEGWEEIIGEIEESVVPRVLLSSEVFQTCTVAQIQQIRSFFPAASVQALVYFRDPIDYMISMYKQRIKSRGENRTFHEFAKARIHLCDYPSLIGRWKEGLGEESVTALSFDKCMEDGLLASFLNVLGQKLSAYEAFVDAPANVSPPDDRIITARRLNRLQAGSWIPDQLLHRIKRNVLRGTWRGRWFARILQAIENEALYGPDEVRWVRYQINGAVKEFMKELPP